MESNDFIVGSRSSKRLALVAVVVVPLLLLFTVLIWSLINQNSGIQEDPMNRNFSSQNMGGIPAPTFTLELFEGDVFRLVDVSGQAVVVSFWSSWCPSCRLEAPVVVEMERRYHEIGVNFIGIAIWDSEVNAKKFAEEHGIKFPVGLDKDGSIAIDYGVTGLPEKFFINQDGEIVNKLVGPVNEQQIEEAILSIVER